MLVKLKGKRVEKGLGQREIAELIGISLYTYNLKENGKVEFRMWEINKILEILDCKYEDIFLN